MSSSKLRFLGLLITTGLIAGGCGSGSGPNDGATDGSTDGARADGSHTDGSPDGVNMTDGGPDVASDHGIVDTGTPDQGTMETGGPDVVDVTPSDALDVNPDLPTLDVPSTDALPDVAIDATDVPVMDMGVGTGPCAPGVLLDLNTAGTLTGSTVDYRGDLTTAPAAAPAGFAPSCRADVGHVVAFSYTLRTTSRLLISTFHLDGADLDTVVVAQTACAFGAPTEIGCDDDVPSADSNRATAPTMTTQSIFTTNSGAGTGTTPAGTTIYIFVAGYSTHAGTYHLSVTEVTPPSAMGGVCEPSATPSLCAATLGCIASGTDTTTFTCVMPVATGGACDSNMITNVCASNAACLGTPSVCVVDVAIGGTCDTSGMTNVCIPGSSCQMGATTATCVADGASGGNCRTTAMPCDTGLTCGGGNTCVPVIAIGGTCDTGGNMNVCIAGSSCQMGATTATCIADGASGGNCRTTGMPCDTGLACGGGLCLPVVAVGGTCDTSGSTNVCIAGSSCQMGATTATCIADGARGGHCRSGAPGCDTGLTCDTANTGLCLTAVAVGGTCDPAGVMNLCVTGSTCVMGSTTATCVADGALGRPCLTTAPACNTGLACSRASNTCVTAVAVGGVCDPAFTTNLCANGSVCVTAGATSHCVAHTYVASASTAAWIDACATTGHTEVLAGQDDNTAATTLPFAFTFYGRAYASGSTGTVSSNGFFSPAAGVSDSHNPSGAFPQEPSDNAIYGMLTDLRLHDVSGATMPRVCLATTGTAPARTYTVEWFHDEFYASPEIPDYVTFEVQLHEGSSAFDILFNTFSGASPAAHTPAVGVESVGGSSWTAVCQGTGATACTATTAVNTHFTASP